MRVSRMRYKRLSESLCAHQHFGRACDAAPLLEDAFAVGAPRTGRLAPSGIARAKDVGLVLELKSDELHILVEGGGDERADGRHGRSVEACRHRRSAF
jgi:hypothetical protein